MTISRAAGKSEFPAKFQLVAAMNPSPTGSINDGRSTSDQVLRYLNKISGPFLDRIDLQVDVPKVPSNDYAQHTNEMGESSADIRLRVEQARQLQILRSGKTNAELTTSEIQLHCQLNTSDHHFLLSAVDRLGLSMRSYHRVLKVARTIADLAVEETIQRRNLLEALSYRSLDNILRQLTH